MPVEEPEVIAKLLRERRGGAVDVLTPQRGEKRALVLLAERNAADALEKRNAQRMIRQERTVGACQALAEAIGMQGYPKRIEGFDISNTQGVLSVASMVVFIDGEPAYREYRHYRIKTVEGANDFASMNEVLGTAFCPHAAGGSCRALGDARSGADRRRPGAAALCARSHAGPWGINVPMFGLAKRLEEIYLPNQEEPVVLDHHTPALHLIQRIRDPHAKEGMRMNQWMRLLALLMTFCLLLPVAVAEEAEAELSLSECLRRS